MKPLYQKFIQYRPNNNTNKLLYTFLSCTTLIFLHSLFPLLGLQNIFSIPKIRYSRKLHFLLFLHTSGQLHRIPQILQQMPIIVPHYTCTPLSFHNKTPWVLAGCGGPARNYISQASLKFDVTKFSKWDVSRRYMYNLLVMLYKEGIAYIPLLFFSYGLEHSPCVGAHWQMANKVKRNLKFCWPHGAEPSTGSRLPAYIWTEK